MPLTSLFPIDNSIAMTSLIPISLQLYTVRDACERDYKGALEAVAAAGYRWIELFGGFYGMKPGELKRLLAGMGLGITSAHVDLEMLETELEQVMDEYEAVGCRTLVCPWLSEERRRQPDVFERLGAFLDDAGELLRARGMKLAYHNHDFEFTLAKDPDGLHQILTQCDPDNLSLEPDVYWLAYAGLDPADYMRRLGSRVILIHLKDGNLKKQTFSPLGEGDVDLPSVIEVGRELGVEAFVVEQDFHSGSPFDSIRASLEYLRLHGMMG